MLGNGDVFSADEALRRMRETGVDGVVIGRGCLGNPWLFRELDAAFAGESIPERPPKEEVVAIIREHFHLLRDHFCERDFEAILRMRKFGAWYASGFRGAAEFRRRFQRIQNEADLEYLLDGWLSGELVGDLPSADGEPALPADSCCDG